MSTLTHEKLGSTSDSPERLLLHSETESTWDDGGAIHTELTDEQELTDDPGERLERLTTQLARVEGATKERIEFAVRVEQLIPDYRALREAWLAEDPLNRGSHSLKLFALE